MMQKDALPVTMEMTSDMRKLAPANMDELWKFGNNIKVALPNLSLKFVNTI